MKKIYLIHGWSGSPNEPMLKWLKKELEKKDFEVTIPEMPDTDEPKIIPWVNKIKSLVKNPNESVCLIGHSIGCQAVLRYLEILDKDVKIGKIILIAPWMELDEETIKEEGEESIRISKQWVETPINWEKIKNHCKDFRCVFSDNDPFVPLSNKKLFEKKLNAKTYVEHDKGHFDPDSGIKEVPYILRLIE